jgi:uncharacterized UPF0160 family protein
VVAGPQAEARRGVIATHSGSFHADDVFAVVVLATLFPQHEIVRSRDPAVVAAADFTVDVGGIWDPAAGRFDHHQRGFEGKRPSGEAYASAGLVWREFGARHVQAIAREQGHVVDAPAAASIAEDVEATLVRYLDLVDNGAADVAPGVFGLSSQVAMLNSSWLEERELDAAALERLQLERFREAMALVDRLLRRFVLRAVGQRLAADTVRASARHLGGRVLLLAEGGMPWTRIVVQDMPEVLLVVYPESGREQYQLRTVPAADGSFASRMDLPQAWAGLRDEELAAMTGVADAVFCHSNLFIAGARSLAGALRMSELALAGR